MDDNYLSRLANQGLQWTKNRAKNVVNELSNAPKSLAQMLDPAWQAQMKTPNSLAKLDELSRDIGMAIGPGAIAWHGSPHLFSKFDLGKIGTGEGAQAYGRGVYLAENPDVARQYAQALDPMASAARSGVDAEGTAARVLQAVDFNKQKAIEELTRRKNMPHVQGDTEWANKMGAAIAKIQGADKTSQLYKTDIPDSHINKMLDWDKPLSEQPQIHEALKNSGFFPRGYDFNNSMETGKSLINNLAPSDHIDLHKAGIPGIKYLDSSSRSGGTGTSNYVMFNPEDIRILERSGIATGQKPWDAK